MALFYNSNGGAGHMAVVMPYGYDDKGKIQKLAEIKGSQWGYPQAFVMSYNSPNSVSGWTREVEKYVYWEPITFHFDEDMRNYVRYYYYKKR
jgi:hypothetical protein